MSPHSACTKDQELSSEVSPYNRRWSPTVRSFFWPKLPGSSSYLPVQCEAGVVIVLRRKTRVIKKGTRSFSSSTSPTAMKKKSDGEGSTLGLLFLRHILGVSLVCFVLLVFCVLCQMGFLHALLERARTTSSLESINDQGVVNQQVVPLPEVYSTGQILPYLIAAMYARDPTSTF